MITTRALAGCLLWSSLAWAAPPEVESFVRAQGKRAGKPTQINKLLKGDLNGDRIPDLVVHYLVQVGAPGNDFVSYIAVFQGRPGGRCAFLTQRAAGAKLAQGLVPVSVRRGVIRCDRYAPNGLERIGSRSLRLVGTTLQEER